MTAMCLQIARKISDHDNSKYSGKIKSLIEVMLVIKKSIRSNLKLPPASFL